MSENIRLSKSDLAAIEYETSLVVGQATTLESLAAEGYSENENLRQVLDWIANAGRIGILFIAEFIQAIGALVIAVTFALLEFWRVRHGAQALGQDDSQSMLIAFAVVTANVVHPIYSLRQLRGQAAFQIVRMTGRGYLECLWKRVTGRPIIEAVALYRNPTLHIAAAVITWSTNVLAIYDILGPLFTQLFTGKMERPLPIAVMELVMGLGLSVAGVFFLQSAAHEIGVRTLTDQPMRLTERLEQRRTEYGQQVIQVRESVRERHIAAKLSAEAQKRGTGINPSEAVHAAKVIASVNGHSSAMASDIGKTSA
jgi:hypothetical protein